MIEPHYSLEEAAAKFFPGGKITGRSLRTEIENGYLPRKKIAGKLVTCATDVARMLERKQCEERKAPGSTSRRRTAPAAPSGLSETERRASARAAALMMPREREERSRLTSQARIDLQRDANR